MKSGKITLFAAVAITLMLGACHSTPKQARYIPKDALAVIAVNTGAISKEVAWSKITGSKILDDMQKSAKSAKDTAALKGLKDIEHSGIDFMNTMYLYLKPDTRFSSSQRATLILPLSKSSDFEAWVKKTWPAANVHAVGNRKEALLDGKWYAGWDGDVAMVMNTVMQPATQSATMMSADTAATSDTTAIATPPYSDYTEKADEPATAAEMETAFKLPKDAAITENAHFNSLAGEGHDVAYYVNYDAIMNSTSALATGAMGMSMGNTLWKGTALTGGFDFEKGAVAGEMKYYTSDSLKEIAKEFGSENFDGDMASRLPGQNMNLAAGYHLSPKAVKLIMDKMGYTGLANMYLASQGFSVDAILSAFTGDIAFSMNNFKMVKEMQGAMDSTSAAFGMTPYATTTPKMDMVLAMKIGNKAAFDKLFSFVNAQAGGGLVQSAPNTYMLPPAARSGNSMMDNMTLIISDKYFAVGTNPASVQAFLKGSGNISDAAKKELSGHPTGFYADLQSLMQGGAAIMDSPSDAAAFAEVRKLFTDVGFHGGEYKGGGNEYNFTLRMVDKSENSLLQLLQFAQRMSALKQQAAPPAFSISL